jgi:hypothetical protein
VKDTTSMLFIPLLAWACGGSLPQPSPATHGADVYREVPYPPPAALAETIPAHPDADAVWIDGEWVFSAGSYTWQRGGWVVPPQEGRFAPWHAYYRADGSLMLAPGTWYDARGRRLPNLEPRLEAYTPPNEFTSESEVGR